MYPCEESSNFSFNKEAGISSILKRCLTQATQCSNHYPKVKGIKVAVQKALLQNRDMMFTILSRNLDVGKVLEICYFLYKKTFINKGWILQLKCYVNYQKFVSVSRKLSASTFLSLQNIVRIWATKQVLACMICDCFQLLCPQVKGSDSLVRTQVLFEMPQSIQGIHIRLANITQEQWDSCVLLEQLRGQAVCQDISNATGYP